MEAALRWLADATPASAEMLRLMDATPIPCGQSVITARRSGLYGWAGYGYCPSHSRWYWGAKLLLICTCDGTVTGFALANPKLAGEREQARTMLEHQPANRPPPGTAIVTDKGLSGEDTEAFFASPDLRPDPDPPGPQRRASPPVFPELAAPAGRGHRSPGTVDGGPANGLTYSHSERRFPSTERELMSHSLRYLANCSMLFTELPLLQRPAAARSAGFGAVEFWWPFEDPVPGDAAVDAFVSAVGDAGVRLVGLNFFAGDLAGPDCGVLSIPARSQQFRDNIDVTVGIGERLGASGFNALYGGPRRRGGGAGAGRARDRRTSLARRGPPPASARPSSSSR